MPATNASSSLTDNGTISGWDLSFMFSSSHHFFHCLDCDLERKTNTFTLCNTSFERSKHSRRFSIIHQATCLAPAGKCSIYCSIHDAQTAEPAMIRPAFIAILKLKFAMSSSTLIRLLASSDIKPPFLLSTTTEIVAPQLKSSVANSIIKSGAPVMEDQDKSFGPNKTCKVPLPVTRPGTFLRIPLQNPIFRGAKSTNKQYWLWEFLAPAPLYHCSYVRVMLYPNWIQAITDSALLWNYILGGWERMLQCCTL
ncbi:hypothetical protein VNO77_27384 [Canavalia gladiata]|uniref:Uncharacterized protein n=1 Tax=Canavalia gladiata TaxID=3824 RepID=A0AAN9Q716_CANGL